MSKDKAEGNCKNSSLRLFCIKYAGILLRNVYG